jgi:predicted kinase
MKYINDFSEFSVNENSKNDPIPEINTSKKLGIILLGTPGVGKSTFAKSFITNKNRNIKIFSTDDISYTFTKQHNTYRKGSSEINLRKLDMFMESGGSFIYDTTGVQHENVSNITEKARKNGYDVIFIHLMAPLDTSLRQNQERERNVPDYYIKHAYERQYKNMHYFSNLNPDTYYIVYSIDGKYKFMKFEDGQILKRKVDKYVPLRESHLDKSIDDVKMFDDIKYFFTHKLDEGFVIDFKYDEINNNIYSGVLLFEIYQRSGREFEPEIFREEFEQVNDYLQDSCYVHDPSFNFLNSFDKLVSDKKDVSRIRYRVILKSK